MKKPKAKVTMTAGTRNILEIKIFGQEPVYKIGSTPSQMDLIKAYGWYNYMMERSDATAYIKAYFKTRDTKIFDALNRTECQHLLTSICWAARMIDNGWKMPTGMETKILNHVQYVIGRYSIAREVVSLIDKSRERVSGVIADIEDMIDRGEDFSVYEYLGTNTVPKVCVEKVLEYYTPVLTELLSVPATKDLQIKEAYRHLSIKAVKGKIALFQSIVDDCDRFLENKKIIRKPRQKKKVSVEKKTQKVQFLEKYDELQLVSKPVTSIIGSKEVWLYNVRYKTLTHLVSDVGFDIKGTTIININLSQSSKKSVGRKPKETLDSVLKAGKVQLRKMMDTIKTTLLEPTGRINKDVLILRTS